jgi:DNA repair protein RadC
MLLRLKSARKTSIEASSDIFKLLQPILLRKQLIDRNREHLWVVGLDHQLRILYIEQVSVGCSDSVMAQPMEVFCMAVRKRCANIIIAHNHTIEACPSEADRRITEKLVIAGEILGITLLDHLVITTQDYYSFADEGIMQNEARRA